MSAAASEQQNPEPVLFAGRYELREELGRGGMGRVDRALDTSTGEEVALKRLLPGAEDHVTTLFEREYHTLASLQHPRIIAVHDFGIADGARYYTMELLEGPSLGDLSPIPYKEACAHLRDVASSLAMLHARRLLHRDLSSGNVRLNAEGRAKLIDFGALTSFGVTAKVVGTPPFMAPEILRRTEADQTADLYALGVLAYRTLTGQIPYPARTTHALERAWRTRPPPPSSAVRDIPPALDALVMSLINLDPLARPVSAATVIDQLNAIADLEPEPNESTTRGYLKSPAIVGRGREKKQLGRHLAHLASGQGALVLIESAPGLGKSRLLSELLLDAQLVGATAVLVAASSETGQLGVIGGLARALLRVAPNVGSEHIEPHLPLLKGQPTLAAETPHARSEVHAALRRWFKAQSAERPLVLIIDDIEAADPASVASLLELAQAARARPILIVSSLRADARPTPAIRGLLNLSSRIKLRPLMAQETDQLLASVVGDVPFRGRLSQWLHGRSGGTPAQCVALLQYLAEQDIITYRDGAFALPSRLDDTRLPNSMEETVAARLRPLSASARALLQALSLHQGTISLELCEHLLPDSDRRELFEALGELVSGELLVAYGDDYRFPQELLHTAVRKSIDGVTERAGRLRLGEALLKLGGEALDPARRAHFDDAPEEVLEAAAEAGHNLLLGGDKARGGLLLRGAGVAMAVRGEGLRKGVPALEAALAAYTARGECEYRRLNLSIPLGIAAAYYDWRKQHHIEDAIEGACDLTGMSLVYKLRPWLGRWLSLGVGLGVGFLRFHLTRRRRAVRNYPQAMMGMVGLVVAGISISTSTCDVARCDRLLEYLEPLSVLPRNSVGRTMYDLGEVLAVLTRGQIAEGYAECERLRDLLQEPGALPGMPEGGRIQACTMILMTLAVCDTMSADDRLLHTLDTLDSYAIPGFKLSSRQLRAMYHELRGDSVRHQALSEQVDALAAGGESTWREDLFRMRRSIYACALTGDLAGMKRLVQQLERAAEDLPSLCWLLATARATYASARGEHAEALAELGPLFESDDVHGAQHRFEFASLYAAVLNAAGDHQGARAHGRHWLAKLRPSHEQFHLLHHNLELQLALADAALGEIEEARTRLDRMVAAGAAYAQPLLVGLTHVAYAQVAILAADEATFESQRALANSILRPTRNPALIAKLEQLDQEANDAGLTPSTPSLRARARADQVDLLTEELRSAVNHCRGPAQRVQRVLDLLIEHAGARAGYLYTMEPDGLRFAAPIVGLEPPEELEQELLGSVKTYHATGEIWGAPDDGFETQLIDDESMTIAEEPPETCAVVLVASGTGHPVVVAVGALVAGDAPLTAPGPTVLRTLATAIYEAGDVRSVYLGVDPMASDAPMEEGEPSVPPG